MSRTLVEGAVFAHRYHVLRCIATGGMGAVYEVVHLGTNRHRALKVMHPHLFHSADMRERFKREARVAAEIQSEYVVDVFDTGVDTETGIPFLVMELLHGEDLRHRLQRVGRLSPHEVVAYLLQVAAALDKSHAASIVHRDLKPENIFLTVREDGLPFVKVLDFGVAKVLAENTANLRETQGLGTPLFMAPEQLATEAIVTPAADIHALGMVTYMLLVGTTYWEQEVQKGNPYHFIVVAAQGVQESAAARAAAQGVRLPAGFDAWFARMTAFRPQDRYSRAGEAIAELEKVLGIQYTGPRPMFAADSALQSFARGREHDLPSMMNAATLTAAVTTSKPLAARRSPLVLGTAVLVLCAIAGSLSGWILFRPAPAYEPGAAANIPHPPETSNIAPEPSVPAIAATSAASLPQIESAAPMAPSRSTSAKTSAPAPRRTNTPSQTTSKPRLDDLLGQH